jgi:bacteriorhodopsin
MSSIQISSLPALAAMTVNWPMVVVLIVAHIGLAFRVSFYAKAMGRRQWLWFAISVCATVLPLMAIAIWYRFGWLVTGAPHPNGVAQPPEDEE